MQASVSMIKRGSQALICSPSHERKPCSADIGARGWLMNPVLDTVSNRAMLHNLSLTASSAQHNQSNFAVYTAACVARSEDAMGQWKLAPHSQKLHQLSKRCTHLDESYLAACNRTMFPSI